MYNVTACQTKTWTFKPTMCCPDTNTVTITPLWWGGWLWVWRRQSWARRPLACRWLLYALRSFLRQFCLAPGTWCRCPWSPDWRCPWSPAWSPRSVCSLVRSAPCLFVRLLTLFLFLRLPPFVVGCLWNGMMLVSKNVVDCSADF